MKSKTLKQFLAEKRKADAQSAETVMKTLDALTHVSGNAYNGSAVIINITDLEGNVLADAAINGEQLEDLRVALMEAYRQTLMAKEPVLRYNLRKMEDMINGLKPAESKQPENEPLVSYRHPRKGKDVGRDSRLYGC